MRRAVSTTLVLLAMLAVVPASTSAHAVVLNPAAATAVTKCRVQVPLIWLRVDRASCAEGKRITLAYRRHVRATHGHTGVQRISGWRCSGSFVGFDEVLLNCSKAIPHNRAKRTIRALFYWD